MTTPSISIASGTLFCKDCEWIATSPQGWERFRCFAPENMIDKELNLVTGETIIRRKVEMCVTARKEEAFCGQTARWFKIRTFKLEPVKEIFAASKSKADEL